MSQLRIKEVNVITHGKEVNGQRPLLNLVVIRLANNKPPVIRQMKQFLEDMKKSGLITDDVRSLQHPKLVKLIPHLRNGIVEGEITHHKAGDKWTVTENSSVITDPTHEMYGKVAVGDQLDYETDGTRVAEGFLFLEPNDRYLNRQAQAEALAEITASVTGLYGDVLETSTTTDSTEAMSEEDILESIPSDFTAGQPVEESAE